MNPILRSLLISIAIASACLFAGLAMVFLIDPPRPGLGWTLVGLGIVLEGVAAVRFALRSRVAEGRGSRVAEGRGAEEP